jgi:Stage II sporulation protein E (SpoIIE)
VVIRDGTADLLELPPGPPLDLGGLPCETVEVGLPEGSLIALYTDGLIGARDHEVHAGLSALRHALVQPASSLERVCDTVLDALLPAGRTTTSPCSSPGPTPSATTGSPEKPSAERAPVSWCRAGRS